LPKIISIKNGKIKFNTLITRCPSNSMIIGFYVSSNCSYY
jgi:hypothetical protein